MSWGVAVVVDADDGAPRPVGRCHIAPMLGTASLLNVAAA